MRHLNTSPSFRLAGILVVLLALPAARGGAGQPSAAAPQRARATVLKTLPVPLPAGKGA